MTALLAVVTCVLLVTRFAGGEVPEALLSTIALSSIASTSVAVALDRRIADGDERRSDDAGEVLR